MRSALPLRLIRRVIPGAAAAVWLLSVQPLPAQTAIADPESYRDEKREATATFLDRGRPQEERLEAAKKLGYPDSRTFAALLAIGADRTQSDAIRWEALRRHRFDDKYLDVVLKILNDPQDGGAELDSRLVEDLSRRATFKLPAEVRQRILAAWRKLLNDPRDPVRLSAYRVLAANHDSVAVNLLAESLRKGKDVPIPLHEAIDLLDLNGSVNYIGALRPYLNHKDPRVQAKAVRALAVDPQSRPRIVELARNPQAPEEVRLNALRALAREDGRFASYAIPMVENPAEDSEIRYAAMQAFAGHMNYNKIEPAEQVRFAQAVERLATAQELTAADDQKIKEAAQKLHVYLRKAFPEVQKHYEKP